MDGVLYRFRALDPAVAFRIDDPSPRSVLFSEGRKRTVAVTAARDRWGRLASRSSLAPLTVEFAPSSPAIAAPAELMAEMLARVNERQTSGAVIKHAFPAVTPTFVVASEPAGLTVQVGRDWIITPTYYRWRISSTHTLSAPAGTQVFSQSASRIQSPTPILYADGRWIADPEAHSIQVVVPSARSFLEKFTYTAKFPRVATFPEALAAPHPLHPRTEARRETMRPRSLRGRKLRRQGHMHNEQDPDRDSSANPRPLASSRGPLRHQRPLQPLLVHVLAHRSRLSQAPTRRKQSRLPPDCRAGPPPGLLAFIDNQAVGWCQLTPRQALPYLDRGRRLKRIDQESVWSLSCFYIRIGFRKKGVTSALIAAALQATKAAHAPALEAYPLDAEKTPSSSSTGYVTTFARAGFKIIASQTPPRPIMRHNLKNIAPLAVNKPSRQ
jgi:hypothetical protein